MGNRLLPCLDLGPPVVLLRAWGGSPLKNVRGVAFWGSERALYFSLIDANYARRLRGSLTPPAAVS